MARCLTLAAAVVWVLIGCAAAEEKARVDSDVLHYDIKLQPDFVTKTISGTQSIEFKSLVDDLTAISFSANSMELAASIEGTTMVSTEVVGDRRIFHLPKAMRAGQVARLVVSFKGAAPKGLVFGEGSVYANYFTCDVLICDQDRTGDKATVDFALLLPTGMYGVAPGEFISRSSAGPGMQLHRWGKSNPTSPYLIGFAAGQYDVVRLPGEGPVLAVFAQHESDERVRILFSSTRNMLQFFEQKSGVKFDASLYVQVLVDGAEAQEAARHSIIGRENIEPILKDPKEDWVIAHELAHQWWGNSLTCKDWSELWLNEGFAVFMTAAWKEHRWGRAAYDHELELANKRWQAAKGQNFDVPLSWQGKYPSLKLKRAMAYAKSVVFLDTLRRKLGERPFWRAIKLYTREHRNDVVTARDLQAAFETASRKDLTPLFAEWVFGSP